MMTVGIMTQTLYYITGGESTVSHRGVPDSNPSQFMWDLCWGKKLALGQVSFQVIPVSRQYHITNNPYAFVRLSPTFRELIKRQRLKKPR